MGPSGSHDKRLPIVREEDLVCPAFASARQQLLCQVQSWLMCIFWENDVTIPAGCICHAAHQLGLQLPTHSLQECVNNRTDTLAPLGVCSRMENKNWGWVGVRMRGIRPATCTMTRCVSVGFDTTGGTGNLQGMLTTSFCFFSLLFSCAACPYIRNISRCFCSCVYMQAASHQASHCVDGSCSLYCIAGTVETVQAVATKWEKGRGGGGGGGV